MAVSQRCRRTNEEALKHQRLSTFALNKIYKNVEKPKNPPQGGTAVPVPSKVLGNDSNQYISYICYEKPDDTDKLYRPLHCASRVRVLLPLWGSLLIYQYTIHPYLPLPSDFSVLYNQINKYWFF
ncbi:hypothetical protein [Bacillus paramycoides]|uniref:hypothetical protein n=1 Tax=Bacillus paramycoides TaxID=2026194 RepID=UPI003D1BAC41